MALLGSASIQLIILSMDNSLEKRVNKRCYSRAAQKHEQAQKQQYNQYGQQPPLLIVFEEEPKLHEQRGSLFLGKLIKFT